MMYDDWIGARLTLFREVVKQSTEEEKSFLLVPDDVTAALKDKEIERLLRDLIIFNRRHYGLSIIIVQRYAIRYPQDPQPLPPIQMTEQQVDRGDIRGGRPRRPREEADEVMRFLFDRPYAVMSADTGTGSCSRFSTVYVYIMTRRKTKIIQWGKEVDNNE
jgi:hypothetical protein